MTMRSEVGFIIDPIAFQESAVRLLQAWSRLSAATVGVDAPIADAVRFEVLSFADAIRTWAAAGWIYRVDAGNADVLDRSAEQYRALYEQVRLARESLGLPRADLVSPSAVRRILDIFGRTEATVTSGSNVLLYGGLLIAAAYFLGGRRS